MQRPAKYLSRLSCFLIACLFFSGCVSGSSLLKQAFLREQLEDALDLSSVNSFRELPTGEKLTYTVKWLGIPVGTLTSSIKGTEDVGSRPAYVLEAVLRTNRFCSKIFPVNDRYVSYVDKRDLRVLRHEVYRREGRYKKDAVTVFDHASGKAYFRNLLDKSEKVFDIPEGVYDFLGAYYFFRSLPLKVGDKIRYTVSADEKNYQVVVMVKSQTALKLGRLGRKKALLIQPYVMREGKELKEGRAHGYYGLEGSRPLLGAVITAPLFTKITAFLSREQKS